MVGQYYSKHPNTHRLRRIHKATPSRTRRLWRWQWNHLRLNSPIQCHISRDWRRSARISRCNARERRLVDINVAKLVVVYRKKLVSCVRDSVKSFNKVWNSRQSYTNIMGYGLELWGEACKIAKPISLITIRTAVSRELLDQVLLETEDQPIPKEQQTKNQIPQEGSQSATEKAIYIIKMVSLGYVGRKQLRNMETRTSHGHLCCQLC